VLFDEHHLSAVREQLRHDTADALLRHACAVHEQALLRNASTTADRWRKRARRTAAYLLRARRRPARSPAGLRKADDRAPAH
jgi:hypothetical protein